jgi:DNA-binding transcriptional LysR family regulator
MTKMRKQNSIYGNLDDLFLFCCVAEGGSLSAAADRLNIPLSTLSRRISTLEKKLGAKLLCTEHRELVPTETGKKLFRELYPGMWTVDRIVGDLQNPNRTLTGLVRITVPRAFYYDILRSTVRKMMREYPNVSFKIEASQLPDLAVLGKDTDIIVSFNTEGLENYVAKPIYRTKLGIFAHKDFFKERPFPSSVAELADLPWISNYPRHHIPIYAEERLVANLEVTPRFVVNDILAVADEVRAGMGIGLIPFAKARKHSELMLLFPGYNGKIRQAYLVYHQTKYAPRVVHETVDRIEAAARDWSAKNDDWYWEKQLMAGYAHEMPEKKNRTEAPDPGSPSPGRRLLKLVSESNK